MIIMFCAKEKQKKKKCSLIYSMRATSHESSHGCVRFIRHGVPMITNDIRHTHAGGSQLLESLILCETLLGRELAILQFDKVGICIDAEIEECV